jgi:succinate dehydrogenase / fumarate reductase, membrane anchor subunit
MISPRFLGSAHAGLGEWLVQRVSALYLAGFVLWLLAHFLLSPPADYPTWKTWLGQGGVRLAFALAYISVLAHAWVGMRSVFLDYIKSAGLRLLLQLLLAVMLMALALWAGQILITEAAR